MSRHSKGTRHAPVGAPLRHAAVFAQREHDPYRARGKHEAPTVCPMCELWFTAGRWQTGR